MRRFLLLLGIGVVLGVIVGGVYWHYFYSSEEEGELVLYGNVDVRQTPIGFRIGGQVDKMFFQEGDIVSKGTLLATLDPSPYNYEELQAQARVHKTRVRLGNAEKILRRRDELIQIGGVSREDWENAEASRDELASELEGALADLAVAAARSGYTKAFAPAEGVILTRIYEPGTVVREADPVYMLSITSPVWVRAFIDEPQLGAVYYGMAAEVVTDTPERPVYHGKVGFISPTAEFTPKIVETKQLRTALVYQLRIYVDDPDHFLKQGMPVTVNLKTVTAPELQFFKEER